jgi:transglutaminase superfamily protein
MSSVARLNGIVLFALLAGSLTAGQDSATRTDEVVIRGPQFHSPPYSEDFEDFASPNITRLRNEYRLDEVVRGETSEFQKLLKLRHWVHSRWPIDNDQKFSGDVFAILEKAKTGAGFYCTHSMRVQHAVMTAMGYVVRDLGVDSDHLVFGKSNHHGVNEVWSNEYAKWVLLDAKYDIHYERAGVPLSALELHEAARSDQGKGIVKVAGPGRREVPMKGLEFPTSSVLSYWWISYNPAMKTFTGKSDRRGVVVFDSPEFRATKWFRDTDEGLGEHWAYRANAFVPVSDRHEINWSVGVPDVKFKQEAPGEVDLTFFSITPNLETYRMRLNNGSWQNVAGDRWHWKLKVGENILDVCTRNRFGVEGPVVTVVVRRPED